MNSEEATYNRKSFTFFREYWDAVKGLTPLERLAAIDGIAEYALCGRCDMKAGRAFEAFMSVKPIIDAEIRESREGRRSKEYCDWRKAVYERDDYRCQECGERGGRLNAHHIKPYAFYPDLRYDLSNGITLCISCHKKTHKRRQKCRTEY